MKALIVRRLVGCITIVAAFGAPAVAAGPISEDIPIPGGTVALARAIGIETPPDPSRFISELTRLIYGLPEGHRDDPSSALQRLTSHLDAVGRLQTALEAVPGGALTFALASSNNKNDRDRLKDVLNVVGLQLKETRGKYSVEATNDKAAVTRVRLLGDLGVDLGRLASRLNAGETVHLAIPSELVPIPLTAALWSEAVFRRSVPPSRLFSAIFADSQAALLCHGLAALDDPTLEYFSDARPLIGRLYTRDSAAFATFASNIRVRGGRVVTPGGVAAIPLWESVVGETITEPEPFILALLSRESGHLAYLYDLVAELDAPRASFALGLWISDERVRRDRFRSLASTVASALAEWQVRDVPFARPLDDIAWMLLNVQVDANGAPRGPTERLLWSRAFESLDLPDEPDGQLKNAEKEGSIDAAWLASAVLTGDQKLRTGRLQQLAFGLRVFGAADREMLGDVLVALRALPAYPALMLTLERMQIRRPAAYAAAARKARRLSELEGGRAFIALNQFQGALALLARMTAVGSLQPLRADSLVASLAAIPLDSDVDYGSRVVEWVRRDLLSTIAPRDDAEQAVLAALAGEGTTMPARIERVSWEGAEYRLDLSAAEERRLHLIRERQHAYSLGTVLELDQIAQTLGTGSIDVPSVRAAAAALQALSPMFDSAGKKGPMPAGVESLPDAREIVDRAMKELAKITKPTDVKKAAGIAEPLLGLSGVVLAEALSSIAYAVAIGNPTATTPVGADVLRRHDFGLALADGTLRHRMAWSTPREIVEAGTPRRVQGSLLGLDLAFAQLSLRRVMAEGLASPPVLLSNDRDTFTRSVALLNPFALHDADRDAIAAAVARGRDRVDAVIASEAPRDMLDALASEIKLDGWRHRAAEWDIAHDPKQVQSLFSLNELLVLGGGSATTLDAWGMAGTPISGCLCTRVGAPNAWRLVSGRPRIGVLSTAVPDLNLHVAVMLAALKLPAPLAKTVLGAAMQDFIDHVRPTDSNDWLTLARTAGAVSRERIEDYVAAATADGPLLPEPRRSELQP